MSRALQISTLVSLIALAVYWWGTDGFRAFTAEAARRERVLRDPRPLPSVTLEDQDGRRFGFEDYRGRLVAVEFIYTRCETICRSLGTAFRRIRDHVPAERLGEDFALLTVSFDPRDDRTALQRYARTHGADGTHWRIARVVNAAAIRALLDAFGVIALPDGLGGYEHNAAIHLLDRDGRLVRIGDIEEEPRDFIVIAGLAP
ncbi:MAG TPA: SCO family protein [Burkholderiales bacterium]|nr:SCO family protein [Burkholderiales bacterium]